MTLDCLDRSALFLNFHADIIWPPELLVKDYVSSLSMPERHTGCQSATAPPAPRLMPLGMGVKIWKTAQVADFEGMDDV